MINCITHVIDTIRQVAVTSLLILVVSAVVLVPFIAMGLALRGY